MRYPVGSVINIKTQYGAVGDGIADDTAALRLAIAENVGNRTVPGILWLPDGIYRVTDQLEWRNTLGEFDARLTLAGESRDGTVIRLDANAPGYGDQATPKAVIFTAAEFFNSPTAGGKDWTNLGEGNTAFRNYLFDLTVEVGTGNPGAIGIDYLANNNGALRNVRIRALGAALAGLGLRRKWCGPALVKNLIVEGFDYGIVAATAQYGVTLEHISLLHQNGAGLWNQGQTLFIRDLFSDNLGPAVILDGDSSLVVLLDGTFIGGRATSSAIFHVAGEYYFRNIAASGYRSVLSHNSVPVPGMSFRETSSQPAVSLFSSPLQSLTLPVAETPEVPEDPPVSWASILAFGGVADDPAFDNSPALQAAIDSGALTAYLPRGSYLFSSPVIVRGQLRRLHCMGSRLGATINNSFGNLHPLFSFAPGVSPVVVIEHAGPGWDVGALEKPVALVDHVSNRSLVIRHGTGQFRSFNKNGALFLEDVQAARVEVNGSRVWARQLNLESRAAPVPEMALNRGGQLWALGLKTEGASTVIRTLAGGKSELLGGFIFPVNAPMATTPAFEVIDAGVSLVYLVQVYAASDPRVNYEVQVRETRGAQTGALTKGLVPPRANGSIMPLFVGYPFENRGSGLGVALVTIGLVTVAAWGAGSRRLFKALGPGARRPSVVR